MIQKVNVLLFIKSRVVNHSLAPELVSLVGREGNASQPASPPFVPGVPGYPLDAQRSCALWGLAADRHSGWVPLGRVQTRFGAATCYFLRWSRGCGCKQK